MRKKTVYIMILWLAAAIAIAGCGKEKAERKSKGPVPVKVVKVKLENLARMLEYVGNIKGRNEAILYPKVSGKVIEKVRDEGSRVNKGDPIVYIDRDEVGLKFANAPVESPLTGVVGRIYVDIGSNVNTQTPVALVTDIAKAEIDLDIPEKYIPFVSPGQEAQVTVDAYPAEQFTGAVTMMSPVVDLQTRTAPIEIIIDNPDHRLRSGMFAKVRLILEKNKLSPVILKEAVIGRADDTYVYVIQDKKALLKKVALGTRQGPYYEVKDGLKEGDLVVIMGQQKLRDGVEAKAEE
jgi:multidrug efflux pump subunit AcrA (membrane-fusion protein)